jgi:hypothetical protein
VRVSFFSVSRTASGEIRQNNGGLERGKGIAIVAEARVRANEVEQHFAARGFA